MPLCPRPCFLLTLTAASCRTWQEFQCHEPAKMPSARFGNRAGSSLCLGDHTGSFFSRSLQVPSWRLKCHISLDQTLLMKEEWCLSSPAPRFEPWPGPPARSQRGAAILAPFPLPAGQRWPPARPGEEAAGAADAPSVSRPRPRSRSRQL